MSLCRVRVIAGAICLFFATRAYSADAVWTGGTSTDFNTGSNWVGGSAPGSPDNAVFSTTFALQPTLSVAKGIDGVWMTGNSGQNVVISGSAGNSLNFSGGTINGTGGLGILVDNANAFSLTINAPISVSGVQTWR
ncbi:MAG: hypothetical protein ACJ8IQ_12065, partial [Chthoniobacterales bacterium]